MQNSNDNGYSSKLNSASTKPAKTPSASSGSKTMAELMSSASQKIIGFKRGDVISGTLTKVTPNEILVDINAKTEALVLEKDKRMAKQIIASFKPGDSVEVVILNPESEMGYPVVSLRRFLDTTLWDRLQKLHKEQQPISIIVTASTKGGFLVTAHDGTSGFLPNSQTISFQDPQELIGKTIDAYIVELIRDPRKVIFSQKKMLTRQEYEVLTKTLKKDQKVRATISHITPFGIFVTFKTDNSTLLDGLIHISEVSWDKVDHLEDMFSIGQQLEAVIIGFDNEAKRINLSLKRLTKDPFEELIKNITIDQKVRATVIKVLETGLVVEIQRIAESQTEVEGFIKKEKIPPTVSYKAGDSLNAIVSEIDKKRHRIILVPVLTEKPIGYR